MLYTFNHLTFGMPLIENSELLNMLRNNVITLDSFPILITTILNHYGMYTRENDSSQIVAILPSNDLRDYQRIERVTNSIVELLDDIEIKDNTPFWVTVDSLTYSNGIIKLVMSAQG